MSKIKIGFKIAVYLCKMVSNFSRFWRIRHFFSPKLISFMWNKKPLYISLPSIYFTGGTPYKKKGPLSGDVRRDIPWVRPHDSIAAANIKLLLSDFVDEAKIISDEDIGDEIICENIVCIGAQSNYIFEQLVIKSNCIAPLQYEIDLSKGADSFKNPKLNQSYMSNDLSYSYGLFAVIKNPHAEDKRIVFIAGLDADSTLGITKVLKNNVKLFFKKIKHIKYSDSGFYCIVKFTKTGDITLPLIFNDVSEVAAIETD